MFLLVDQEIIHNSCCSLDPLIRAKGLQQLEYNFSSLPNREQAWRDIIERTRDEDLYVKKLADSILEFESPDIIDMQQAWSDLIKLTNNRDNYVRYRVSSTLSFAVSHSPDKQQAWNDLIKLTNNKDVYVRSGAVVAISSIFSQVPDKQQAWNDLHRLTNDKRNDVRASAASALGSVFSQVSDKQQAWNDLHRLITDKNSIVRFNVISAVDSFFPYLQDKQEVWKDLIKLTSDKDRDIRSKAAYTLHFSFTQVPDKQEAWNDLHRLTHVKKSEVRARVAYALGSAFVHMEDKEQIWNDLHRLIKDKSHMVRYGAASALGFAFSQMPDEQGAWNDLHRLTNDKDLYVRSEATIALGSVFFYVRDKQQVWSDLIKLLNDKNSSVRSDATYVLDSVFSYMPEKQEAWNDLILLINDRSSYVSSDFVTILGSLFSQVPDKQQAWNDLIKLTSNKRRAVRCYANHSLGKVSIFKASQAGNEEDYKKELENAIEFFEKSAKESYTYFNPSQFCLPFYRSLHTIIFESQEVREEVEKYLTDAKKAVGDSKSKELLFEAVNNLANALKEIQKLENLEFQVMKDEINFYRKYCENAAELMRDTEKAAPFATASVRRGLPLLDRKLKNLLNEIQEKAKAVCKQTIGTPAQSLGLEANRTAKKLSERYGHPMLDSTLDEPIEAYKNFCGYLLLEKRFQFLKMIDEIKNMEFFKKLEGITKINDYILRNALFPRIENVHIADRVKDNVRIATVQLNYILSENFPFRIKDEDKKEMNKKILYAISRAQDEEVNILCLPELCNCEEWLPEIRSLCQKMIVISGTYYDKKNHNICRLVTDSDVEISPQLKIVPSDPERSDIIGQRMAPGEKVLNVYESQFGKFAVLICRDFGNFSAHLRGIADIILCPSYNAANERFQKIAHQHVTDSPSYIIISNTAHYGGTSIFGRMKKDFFGALEQGNCKEKGDTSYKLCHIEKGKEGMIIADFNLIYKYPPLQTPMNPHEEIIPVKNIKKLVF